MRVPVALSEIQNPLSAFPNATSPTWSVPVEATSLKPRLALFQERKAKQQTLTSQK